MAAGLACATYIICPVHACNSFKLLCSQQSPLKLVSAEMSFRLSVSIAILHTWTMLLLMAVTAEGQKGASVRAASEALLADACKECNNCLNTNSSHSK